MRRLLNWFRRDALEQDLDRELRYHLDRRVADLMQSGLDEREARRQATLEFGGLEQVQEEVRDVWLTRWLRDFVYDLRFSARSLSAQPLVHRDRRAVAGAWHRRDHGDLFARRPGHPPRASGPRARAAGPRRLEGRSGRERVRHLEPDVVPDLPRPSAARPVLRRRALPRGDDRDPVDGRRAHTRWRRRSSPGTYFSVLGVGPALGRVLDEGRRWDAGRERGGRAVARVLADAAWRARRTSSAARCWSTTTR